MLMLNKIHFCFFTFMLVEVISTFIFNRDIYIFLLLECVQRNRLNQNDVNGSFGQFGMQPFFYIFSTAHKYADIENFRQFAFEQALIFAK